MLKGTELLAKVKELGDASKSELVRETGFVTTKKDGTERLNFTAFYEALLEAKGVGFAAAAKGGTGGRRLSYLTKVQFNGNLLVGKAYTALLDLQPGDEFEIKLSRSGIRLVPVSAAGSEAEDAGESPLGSNETPEVEETEEDTEEEAGDDDEESDED